MNEPVYKLSTSNGMNQAGLLHFRGSVSASALGSQGDKLSPHSFPGRSQRETLTQGRPLCGRSHMYTHEIVPSYKSQACKNVFKLFPRKEQAGVGNKDRELEWAFGDLMPLCPLHLGSPGDGANFALCKLHGTCLANAGCLGGQTAAWENSWWPGTMAMLHPRGS